MPNQAITTTAAPAPVGPYNQAVLAGGWLYCSGQIPLDPATGGMVGDGDVAAETHQVLKNLKAVLTEAGASAEQVVRTTVFWLISPILERSTPSMRRCLVTELAQPEPAFKLQRFRKVHGSKSIASHGWDETRRRPLKLQISGGADRQTTTCTPSSRSKTASLSGNNERINCLGG